MCNTHCRVSYVLLEWRPLIVEQVVNLFVPMSRNWVESHQRKLAVLNMNFGVQTAA